MGGEPWPQFRGPNASGISREALALPGEIGPSKNLLWRTPLPPGHSSPAVHDGRIYVTGTDGKRLFTLGLDGVSGAVVWSAEAPHDRLEIVHSRGSLAQPSPATDGERVVSFFGSAGLLCYDTSGKPLWQVPLGPFKNEYGAASSPIIVGDTVILAQDHDEASFLLAVDKTTGRQIWKTDRAEFPRGFSTPVIWDNGGKRQVVVAGTLRLVGYNLNSGEEAWSVRGIARVIDTTPTIGDDGILYGAFWSPGADGSDKIKVPSFAEAIARGDKNRNGVLDADESADPAVKTRFPQVDRDKDGKITEIEYTSMAEIFDAVRNVALAVKPGGEGDITSTHVLWRQDRMLPYTPSPLVQKGVFYMVKNGGILSSLDAKTGKVIKQGRVSGTGEYFSSPVAGDGKLYMLSVDGVATVVTEEGEWRELSHGAFDEPAFSTPAISGGRIYLRTEKALYCFGAAAVGN